MWGFAHWETCCMCRLPASGQCGGGKGALSPVARDHCVKSLGKRGWGGCAGATQTSGNIMAHMGCGGGGVRLLPALTVARESLGLFVIMSHGTGAGHSTECASPTPHHQAGCWTQHLHSPTIRETTPQLGAAEKHVESASYLGEFARFFQLHQAGVYLTVWAGQKAALSDDMYARTAAIQLHGPAGRARITYKSSPSAQFVYDRWGPPC